MKTSAPPETASAVRGYAKSAEAFARARRLMPGGVSSPVRAYKSVGREPIFIASGKGARVTDLDGNSYIDYVLSYGPLILGHAPDTVLRSMTDAASRGTSFGMPIEAEAKLAELIIEAVPSVELVRFVNSGTEAVMSALRLARAFTGRNKIIKCTGCYHGHTDALLASAGSGVATLGLPDSPGVPQSVTANTVLVPYNDLAAVDKAFNEFGRDIAAMILEPIAGNMGTVLPKDGYLQGLRKLCDQHGALLLFDEVMTGFRVAYGGAQKLYAVKPDLTTLGKVVGGGLPCAAYGGREEIMRQVAPDGPMYQAGTLSGNPLAMAAGIAMLQALHDGAAYERIERSSHKLQVGLESAAKKAGVPVRVARVGSMITPFFASGAITNWEEAKHADTKAFGRFFGVMLDRGVVLPPSQYETWFLSTEHDDAVIEETVAAAEKAFAAAARG
jgi:glutamate-1-semialdehyde 2,1-aminomutase